MKVFGRLATIVDNNFDAVRVESSMWYELMTPPGNAPRDPLQEVLQHFVPRGRARLRPWVFASTEALVNAALTAIRRRGDEYE